MEDNSKDIGRAIRAKLEGYNKIPSDAPWEKIQAHLEQGRRRQQKRQFMYWLKRMAPVLLLLLLAGGYWLYNNNNSESNTINGNTTNGLPATGEEINNGAANQNSVVADNAADGKGQQQSANTDAATADGATTEGAIQGAESNRDAAAIKENAGSLAKGTKGAKANTDASVNNGVTSAGNTKTAGISGRKSSRKGSAQANGSNTGAYAVGSSAKSNGAQKHGSNKGKHSGLAAAKGDEVAGADDSKVAGVKKSGGRNAKGKATNAKAKHNKSTVITQEETDDIADESKDNPQETAAKNSVHNYRNNRANPVVAYVCDTDSTCVVKQHKDSIPKQNKNKTKSNQDGTAVNLDYKEFYAFAYAAPTEFMFKDGHSLIDARFNSNSADTKLSVGYGAYIGYRFSAKASLRAGVMFAKIEQTTNKAYVAENGMYLPDFTGVDYDEGISNQVLSETFQGDRISLVQKTSLLEIPLEFEYRLTSGRFGISALAGVSAISIGTNTLTALGSGQNIKVGSIRANDNISFSTGAGLQVHYAITPALQINAEPYFKYYMNTFNKEPNDTKPFSIAVRAGLQYNFDLK